MLASRRVRVDLDGERKRVQSIRFRWTEIFGVDDRAKRLWVALSVGDTECDGNVVDGLDVVCGIERYCKGLTGRN
jgi:hypothetical protein